MHGEGISTPCVRHKGRQPLIECARHDFKIMYFPFFMFLFLFFGVDKGYFLIDVVMIIFLLTSAKNIFWSLLSRFF